MGENHIKDSLFYITTQTGEKCYVPLHKWKFFDGKSLQEDRKLSFNLGAPLLYSQVNIGSSSRQNALHKFQGCYFPTGEFSCGRQIFKHGEHDDFIMKVRPSEVFWSLFAKNAKLL